MEPNLWTHDSLLSFLRDMYADISKRKFRFLPTSCSTTGIAIINQKTHVEKVPGENLQQQQQISLGGSLQVTPLKCEVTGCQPNEVGGGAIGYERVVRGHSPFTSLTA